MISPLQTSPILVTEYSLNKITNEQWNEIANTKHSFILGDNDPKFIQFPGFVSDHEAIIKAYDEEVYSPLKYNDEFTPPRGNLRSDVTHIVVGYKPGDFFQHLSKAETSWLLGPSSKMLHRLLFATNVYPYFTNVYKNHEMKFGDIMVELEFLTSVFPDALVVFLGSYTEYNTIVYKFNQNNKKIRFINIWHPAYLLRVNTLSNFEKWKEKFTSA